MVFWQNGITFAPDYVLDYMLCHQTKSVLFKRILIAINASEGRIEVASAAIEVTVSGKTGQNLATTNLNK